MNVLLIAPYVNLKFDISSENDRREDFYPSAALLHLGAILRANDFEPTILDFNNSKIHFQRERYLENCIRSEYKFEGAPLKIRFRGWKG